MMDNNTVRKYKSALTRAKKVGPEKVIEVCDIALDDFAYGGYPDCWANWARAKYDAQLEVQSKNWINRW